MSAPRNDPRLRDAAARDENRMHIDPDAPPSVIESQIDAKRADISRTLNELEQRFSPNQMMDYVRDNGGEVAENLGRSFKRNPVPFIVTGVGLAWLMSTTQGGSAAARDDENYRRYRSRYYGPGSRHELDDDYPEAYGHGADPYARNVGRGFADHDRASTRADAVAAFGSDVTDTTPYARGGAARDTSGSDDDESLLDKARAKAEDVGRSIGEGVESLQGAVGDGRERTAAHYERMRTDAGYRAQSLRRDAAEHYERMRTDAGYRADALRRDAARRYDAMRASGRDAGYRARHQARQGMEQASDFLQEQPLVAAAVGIAVGALIGSLLPATRTEDRYLGEYADEVRGEAKSVAAQKAEQLRGEAGRVAQEVRESAEQGLSQARSTVEEKLEQGRKQAEDGLKQADAKADEQGERAAAKVDEKTTTGQGGGQGGQGGQGGKGVKGGKG